MIMKIYSVRDVQVEGFLQPFFSPTNGSAIRSLQEVVNDSSHTFSRNAVDYVLYYLGEFDDSSGLITGSDPVRVLPLSDLVNNKTG